MSLLKYLPTSVIPYILYVIAISFWMFTEILDWDKIQIWGYEVPVRSPIFEVLIGLSSIVVVLKLYLELKEARTQAREVEEKLHAAHSRLPLPKDSSLQVQFWDATKEQFKRWTLTPSETELALMLLRGFSNQQIAAIKNKSLRTVENHSFNLYRKSGMNGKLEFIAYFIEPLLPEED
jgi:DNA-binding CsgD family transcriptional regulator